MRTLIYLAIISTLLFSCDGDEEPIPPPKVTSISPGYGFAGTSINITGTNFGTEIDRIKVTFANGQEGQVTGVSDTEMIVVAAAGGSTGPITITVEEQSIETEPFKLYALYYFGAELDGAIRATIWKDGVATRLSSLESDVVDMVVSGNDVHAIGEESGKAVYWKNGTKVPVTSSDNHTEFTGLSVVGEDVYISGWSYAGGLVDKAKYWKNGNEVILDEGLGVEATDIQVVGSDIHVSGRSSTGTAYWKNGEAIETDYPSANTITVAGADVYLTTRMFYDALFMKNGNYQMLTDNSDVRRTDFANCVFVSGSDVYVGGGGFTWTPGMEPLFNNAAVWKNGVMTVMEGENKNHPMEVVCISEFEGNILMTVSARKRYRRTPSWIYLDDVAIVAYDETDSPTKRIGGHQVVLY